MKTNKRGEADLDTLGIVVFMIFVFAFFFIIFIILPLYSHIDQLKHETHNIKQELDNVWHFDDFGGDSQNSHELPMMICGEERGMCYHRDGLLIDLYDSYLLEGSWQCLNKTELSYWKCYRQVGVDVIMISHLNKTTYERPYQICTEEIDNLPCCRDKQCTSSVWAKEGER